jgi:acyl-CoA thioesterase-1
VLLLTLSQPVAANDFVGRIAVIGDSYSAVSGEMTPEMAWPYQLNSMMNGQRREPLTIFRNFSRHGETSGSAAALLPQVLAWKPNMAIVAVGGTDIEHNLDPNVTWNSLEQILQVLRRNGIYTMVIGFESPVDAPMSYSQRFQRMYQDLAARYQAVYIPDLLAGFGDDWKLRRFENPYPSQEGMTYIAGELKMPLRRMLKQMGQ